MYETPLSLFTFVLLVVALILFGVSLFVATISNSLIAGMFYGFVSLVLYRLIFTKNEDL